MSTKKVVLPGEFLATEEEFVPGKNAFDDEEGNVFSGSLGSVETDSTTKEISVKPSVGLHKLKRGSIVYGRVALVKDNSLTVNLLRDPDKAERQILAPSVAMLPVRSVSREYVRNLKDFFKIGDIVKARVDKIIHVGIDIATNDPDLGVIKAFCSRCRHPLYLFGTSLKCMSCGSTENRKIARGYLVK